MNIFFCDIMGTFSGNSENRQMEIEKLVQNLNDIIEVDNLSSLYFSFISSDHMSDVKLKIGELQGFIYGEKLKIGPQFSSSHILINGERKRYASCKLTQMMNFLEQNKIDNIYYADDCLMNQKLFERIVKTLHPEINIQSFIPGTAKISDIALGTKEKEIVGLNKLLNLYVLKRKNIENKEVKVKTL